MPLIVLLVMLTLSVNEFGNRLVVLKVLLLFSLQGHSHWGEGAGTLVPHLIFRTKHFSKSNSLNFKHQEYCFLRVLRNYTDQKFHDFYPVYYNFWTIYSGFSFSLTTQITHVGSSENIRYLTLDLLKSFLLWAIQKKTTMNESFNVTLKAESWTYGKSPLKQEKHPYKWSAIVYNSISTRTYENK